MFNALKHDLHSFYFALPSVCSNEDDYNLFIMIIIVSSCTCMNCEPKELEFHCGHPTQPQVPSKNTEVQESQDVQYTFFLNPKIVTGEIIVS